MATLHFIWWGPFNPASCERAKEIVNKIGPTPITFWCKQPEVPRYRYAMLGFSSITVRSCSSLRDLAGAATRPTGPGSTGPRVSSTR
jgi:hypothetical protein